MTSRLTNSVILTSAVVGCVVGVIQLNDRFFGAEQALPVVQPGQEPRPDPAPERTAPATPTPTSAPIEAKLGQRLDEMLRAKGCTGLSLSDVAAVLSVTPAAESSSGFDGYFLEGSATLAGLAAPHRLRLLGTGKGPAGEAGAIDMALRGAETQLAAIDGITNTCGRI